MSNISFGVDAFAQRNAFDGAQIQTLGAIYGGGRHGAFVLDGVNTYAAYFSLAANVYTQLQDVYATTIYVSPAVTVKPSQFWIYAETSLTNDGNININGVTLTAIAAAGTLQAGGSVGASSRSTTGVGANGNTTANSFGGSGGAGGAGGANAGGSGGVRSGAIATTQATGSAFVREHHRTLNIATVTVIQGGASGGAGGFTANAGAGNSGQGGGGSSALRINARLFVNNGTVSANGGPGGPATGISVDAVGGGGGGGGGGTVIIMCDTVGALGTVQALGGLGGAGVGTGAVNGSAGNAGLVEVISTSGTLYL